MTGTLEKNSTPSRRTKKYMRGVCYDKRIRKFVASITIKGKRIYLGAFDTEDEASGWHALARHDNPIRRGGPNGEESFAEAYDAFLVSQPAGALQPGTEFNAPSGQRYLMIRADTIYHPTIEGPKWAYYRWLSKCSECDAEFITTTKSSKKHVTGFTRTCPRHRKGGPRGDEPAAHIALLRSVSKRREADLEADRLAEEEMLNNQYSVEELLPMIEEHDLATFVPKLEALAEKLGRGLKMEEFFDVQKEIRNAAKSDKSIEDLL